MTLAGQELAPPANLKAERFHEVTAHFREAGFSMGDKLLGTWETYLKDHPTDPKWLKTILKMFLPTYL